MGQYAKDLKPEKRYKVEVKITEYTGIGTNSYGDKISEGDVQVLFEGDVVGTSYAQVSNKVETIMGLSDPEGNGSVL